MTRDDLRKAIFESLAAVAPEADPTSLAPGDDLREALDIDSMDFLGFVTALRDNLGVTVPESDYPQILTLAGCEEYLASKV